MKNALSVDVEDYFMVENFAGRIPFEKWGEYPLRLEKSVGVLLDLFEEKKVHGTFFILGWVAERLPAVIKKIAQEGHEVACHGYSHRPVYELGEENFRNEVGRAKRILEDVSGKKVIGYRAATYSINEKTPWALDVLCELGFQYDSSYRPIFNHSAKEMPVNKPKKVGTARGKKMVEYPISVREVLGLLIPFCGGGYLRLFPTTWVASGIRNLNEKKIPANVYLHPWEVDPEQPRLPASPLARFRHYVNLAKTEIKLRRLLEQFSFAPVREVLGL